MTQYRIRSEAVRVSRRRGGAIGSVAAGIVLASVGLPAGDAEWEGSPGWIRELQGLSWNLVPVLTVLGGVTGWLLSGPRGPRAEEVIGAEPPAGRQPPMNRFRPAR